MPLPKEEAQLIRHENCKMQIQIEEMQRRLSDYDRQFSQMAQCLGGDATNARGSSFADFVCETVEDLRAKLRMK